MPQFRRTAWCFALLAATAAPARAQEAAPAERGGDSTVIDFIYPGRFADARAQAKARNRCILVKGVAFGVDAEGATCATKGHW